jgi:hypothetical protein
VFDRCNHLVPIPDVGCLILSLFIFYAFRGMSLSKNSARRKLTTPERFRCKVVMEARPVGVRQYKVRVFFIPRKMILPSVLAWMVERNQDLVVRVDDFNLVVFMAVTS